MRKINNKGFVLVETIIVSVFIMGLCTFLFLNILPLIGEYEKIENYDSLDSKYAIHEIRKFILREIKADSTKKTVLTSVSSFYKYTNNNDFCNKFSNNNYCNKLLSSDYLDVTGIIISNFKLSYKNSISNSSTLNRGMKEYIEYLPTYSKYSSRYNNYYRLIIEFSSDKYATIEVKYE